MEGTVAVSLPRSPSGYERVMYPKPTLLSPTFPRAQSSISHRRKPSSVAMNWRDRSTILPLDEHEESSVIPAPTKPNRPLLSQVLVDRPQGNDRPALFPELPKSLSPPRIDATDRLSKYLSDDPSSLPRVDPGDRIQLVRRNRRARMKFYDGMTVELYIAGDPMRQWFCHADGCMHLGIKSSDKYVYFVKIIATHDKEKESWDEEEEASSDDDDDGRLGKSLPCTPRSRNGNGIPRSSSTNGLPSLLHESMESRIQHKPVKDLPSVYVTWYGITNGKAVTSATYEHEQTLLSWDVSPYVEKPGNVGMHSKMPAYIPACWNAREGGLRVMSAGQVGRECSILTEEPMTERRWKREFDGHSFVFVKVDKKYRIDEAYIDMEHQLDPLKHIVTYE